jgi:hypothetical protein
VQQFLTHLRLRRLFRARRELSVGRDQSSDSQNEQVGQVRIPETTGAAFALPPPGHKSIPSKDTPEDEGRVL